MTHSRKYGLLWIVIKQLPLDVGNWWGLETTAIRLFEEKSDCGGGIHWKPGWDSKHLTKSSLASSWIVATIFLVSLLSQSWTLGILKSCLFSKECTLGPYSLEDWRFSGYRRKTVLWTLTLNHLGRSWQIVVDACSILVVSLSNFWPQVVIFNIIIWDVMWK